MCVKLQQLYFQILDNRIDLPIFREKYLNLTNLLKMPYQYNSQSLSAEYRIKSYIFMPHSVCVWSHLLSIILKLQLSIVNPNINTINVNQKTMQRRLLYMHTKSWSAIIIVVYIKFFFSIWFVDTSHALVFAYRKVYIIWLSINILYMNVCVYMCVCECVRPCLYTCTNTNIFFSSIQIQQCDFSALVRLSVTAFLFLFFFVFFCFVLS